MRYHTIKPQNYVSVHGRTYICNHPVYKRCTLYLIDGKGLAVIQQRFNRSEKTTYWTEIDEWLTDLLYCNKNFEKYFQERAGIRIHGLYPTVTIRQIMWALKMKPLAKEPWETCFDRRNV